MIDTLDMFVSADAAIAWLRDFSERRISSAMMDARRTITPHVVLEFGNRGILGMVVPRALGGPGFTQAAMVRVGQQLAAIDLTLAAFVGVNNALGLFPIVRYGDARQQARLPELARGRQLACFALTEPGAGSDPRSIAAVARSDGPGRWRLSGRKIWIGTAAWSGVMVVFARLVDHDGQDRGITAFLLPSDRPNLHQGRETLTLGLRAMVQNDVILDQVPVTDADILGGIGGGLTVAHDAMRAGRLGLGAICAGGMKRCVQLMARYARRRDVAGTTLFARYHVRAILGDAVHAVAAVELLVDWMAAALDADAELPEIAYFAVKIIAPELLWHCADRLVQLLGGRGYDEANAAARLLRDARIVRIFEGPTDTMRAYLGMVALFQPRVLAGWFEPLGSVESCRSFETLLAGLRADVDGDARARGDGEKLAEGLAIAAGEAAAWLFLHGLAATVRPDGTPPRDLRLDDWIGRRLDDALRALCDFPAAMAERPDGATLDRWIVAYDDEIGPGVDARPYANDTADPLVANGAGCDG